MQERGAQQEHGASVMRSRSVLHPFWIVRFSIKSIEVTSPRWYATVTLPIVPGSWSIQLPLKIACTRRTPAVAVTGNAQVVGQVGLPTVALFTAAREPASSTNGMHQRVPSVFTSLL